MKVWETLSERGSETGFYRGARPQRSFLPNSFDRFSWMKVEMQLHFYLFENQIEWCSWNPFFLHFCRGILNFHLMPDWEFHRAQQYFGARISLYRSIKEKTGVFFFSLLRIIFSRVIETISKHNELLTGMREKKAQRRRSKSQESILEQ